MAKEGTYYSVIEKCAKMPLMHTSYSSSYTSNDDVSVGMHVVLDTNRPTYLEGGEAPTEEAALETSRRPARTNVGQVQLVHPDGKCDVQLLCNCAAGWSDDASARQQLGAPTCQACNAGDTVALVDPAQRQICCSACFEVGCCPPNILCPTPYSLRPTSCRLHPTCCAGATPGASDAPPAPGPSCPFTRRLHTAACSRRHTVPLNLACPGQPQDGAPVSALLWLR